MGIFEHLNHQAVTLSNGEVIRFGNTVKSLGVVFDNILSWKPQEDQITNKINRVLLGLRFINPRITQTLRKRLVESLIVPYLDYCSVVYINVSIALRASLQRLCNVGVLYIFGVSIDTRKTLYRSQLEWLWTDSHRSYFAFLVMYMVVRIGEPKILTLLFVPHFR